MKPRALITLPIAACIALSGCGGGTPAETSAPLATIPQMTDAQYKTFRTAALKIDPKLDEDHLRTDARNSCSTITEKNAAEVAAQRFSRGEHTVSKADAKKLVALIKKSGFCGH